MMLSSQRSYSLIRNLVLVKFHLVLVSHHSVSLQNGEGIIFP